MRHFLVLSLLTLSAAAPTFAADILLPDSLTVTAGQRASFTVTLAQPAPSGGTFVYLATNDSSKATLSVSAVLIPMGSVSSRSIDVIGVSPGTTSIIASSIGLTGTTQTVTVLGPGAIILPGNLTVSPNQSTAFPVTLSSPAPAGGVTIVLTDSDPAKAVLSPAIVSIEAGSTAPLSQPQITGIAPGTVTVTASAPGYTSAAQTVAVQAGLALSFSSVSITLTAGSASTVQLTLTAPAPAGGAVVKLTSSSAAASVPATVSIGGNATTVNVAITGVAPGSATITASAANIASALLGVTVASATGGKDINIPSGIAIAPGQQLTFPVTLNQPAPSGGVYITLSSSDESKVVISPSAIVIAQGLTSTPRQPHITGIAAGSAVITASSIGLTGDRQTVLVGMAQALLPSSLTVNGTGATAQLTLTLSAPASSAQTFNLSSANASVATVPASVTVAAGSSTAPIPIQSAGPGTTTIRSSSPNFADSTATVTVVSAGTIGLPSGVIVPTGQSAAFPVSLGAAAPAGGALVNLSSSDPSTISISPATVLIPAGSAVPATQPQVTGLRFGSVTITAAAQGYTSAAQLVQSQSALHFSPASLAFNGPATQTLTLSISASASAAVTVNLTSSNPSVATVPATATIPAGSTSATVNVSGLSAGSATITASAPNLTGALAAVSVGSSGTSGTITLPQDVKIGISQPVPFPVTLSPAAPAGGVLVSLSSNFSALTMTATVFVPAGSTSPVAQPQLLAGAFGSAVITATAPGYNAATATVRIGGALSFASNSIALTSGGTGTARLNLSTAAPSGGLTVNLTSSNSAAVAAPATATIPANATGVDVILTGVAAGSSTITASANAVNVTGTSASVTVTAAARQDIILTSGLTLAVGQQTALNVMLAQPAGPGGVMVNLASGDTSKVSISPATILIGQGAISPSRVPQITGVSAGSAVITASSIGLAPESQTVVVGSTTPPVTGGPALTFSSNSVTVSAGSLGNVQLIVSSAPASGGMMVNLASSNTAAATVPPTVTIPAGATSVNVPITGVSAGSALITASTSTAAGASTSVSVVSAGTSGDIVMPPLTLVTKGNQVPFPITLAQAAPPGGVIINVSSNDSSIATIQPSSFSIPQGATAPSSPPKLTGIALGTVVIAASSIGMNAATQTVQVGGPPGFSSSSLVITGTAVTQSITFYLPAAAPAGGLALNLTSDNSGIATVPATVKVLGGAISVDIPVTSVAEGYTLIHASSLPAIQDTWLTVTVTTNTVSAIWHGACWYHGTIFGYTGNFQGMDFVLSTPAPVAVQGSLFFNNTCSGMPDNMNDFNQLTSSTHTVQGFTHYPDVIPSSAVFWVGPRTADGQCPKGVPCSGCVVYTAATPDCATMP